MNGPQQRGELIAGTLAIALGVAMVALSRGFPSLPSGRPGPGLFPLIVGVALATLGLTLVIQIWRRRPVRNGGEEDATSLAVLPAEGVVGWLAVALAPVLFLVLSSAVGSVITFSVISLALMAKFGVSLPKALLVSAAAAILATYLFDNILGVPLP